MKIEEFNEKYHEEYSVGIDEDNLCLYNNKYDLITYSFKVKDKMFMNLKECNFSVLEFEILTDFINTSKEFYKVKNETI